MQNRLIFFIVQYRVQQWNEVSISCQPPLSIIISEPQLIFTSHYEGQNIFLAYTPHSRKLILHKLEQTNKHKTKTTISSHFQIGSQYVPQVGFKSMVLLLQFLSIGITDVHHHIQNKQIKHRQTANQFQIGNEVNLDQFLK